MPRLTLPWAIVLAGFATGGGLFLGLRTKSGEQPGVGVPSASLQAAPSNEPAKIEPELEQRIQQALDGERTRLDQACWSVQGISEASFDVRLIFNGRGQLLSYGVNDPEDVRLIPIAACLRKQTLPITFPSQGRPVSMRLPLKLP